MNPPVPSVLGRPAGPMRIDGLATLPVFFKLAGRRVLLVGGGEPVVWKAELLAAAGAAVHIHADDPSPALLALAASAASGTIIVNSRPWGLCDLVGAALAVGDFEDETQASRFATVVRAAGIPVNVIDKPAYCDFQFGALVNRSPLIIAISTDGAAPVFGQAIRARIETLLPKGFTRWAEAAKAWRARFQATAPDFRTRRRFWERFTAEALAEPDRRPTESDFENCLAAAVVGASSEPTAGGVLRAGGRISMMRVEPGLSPSIAAERLTLLAIRLLGAADVVVYDHDMPATVLEFARRESRRIAVDGDGDGDGEAAVALSLEFSRGGQQVVRLVLGGDDRICRETAAIEREYRSERIAEDGAGGVLPKSRVTVDVVPTAVTPS